MKQTTQPVKSATIIASSERELLSAEETIVRIFPSTRSRPSIRWFRGQWASGRIPGCKVGGKVFFDPVAVRQAILK